MTASVPFNYMPTTNAQGSFNAQSTGWVVGTFLDDPAVRYLQTGGVLATSETLPMWGGVGINETVTPNGSSAPDGVLGGLITRATNVTAGAAGQLTGFSVFNQAYGMVITPQSPVPLAASGMQVQFFRLGSNARIAVACSALLSSLEQGTITQQVSWDFGGQELIPYVAAYSEESVESATYASSTGILALTFATAPFGSGVGSTLDGVPIVISGMSPSSLNGTWNITSTASSGTVINVQATEGLGSLSPSGGQLNAGGGALPCKVLSIESGNSMTVSYSLQTGYATWNYSGTVAILLI